MFPRRQRHASESWTTRICRTAIPPVRVKEIPPFQRRASFNQIRRVAQKSPVDKINVDKINNCYT
jgi:hypothetical protein